MLAKSMIKAGNLKVISVTSFSFHTVKVKCFFSLITNIPKISCTTCAYIRKDARDRT